MRALQLLFLFSFFVFFIVFFILFSLHPCVINFYHVSTFFLSALLFPPFRPPSLPLSLPVYNDTVSDMLVISFVVSQSLTLPPFYCFFVFLCFFSLPALLPPSLSSQPLFLVLSLLFFFLCLSFVSYTTCFLCDCYTFTMEHGMKASSHSSSPPSSICPEEQQLPWFPGYSKQTEGCFTSPSAKRPHSKLLSSQRREFTTLWNTSPRPSYFNICKTFAKRSQNSKSTQDTLPIGNLNPLEHSTPMCHKCWESRGTPQLLRAVCLN